MKIGANAVVYKDVPDNAIVVLDPGFRIVAYVDSVGESDSLPARADEA